MVSTPTPWHTLSGSGRLPNLCPTSGCTRLRPQPGITVQTQQLSLLPISCALVISSPFSAMFPTLRGPRTVSSIKVHHSILTPISATMIFTFFVIWLTCTIPERRRRSVEFVCAGWAARVVSQFGLLPLGSHSFLFCYSNHCIPVVEESMLYSNIVLTWSYIEYQHYFCELRNDRHKFE